MIPLGLACRQSLAEFLDADEIFALTRAGLYALSELSPRSDAAIGRGYLAGRYGATPVFADKDFTQVAVSAVGALGEPPY